MSNIQSISFQKEEMIIEIDNLKYNINLKKVSEKLFNATAEERNNYEISPANYGIHWPLIDEDLSIKGIIEKSIKH